MVFNSLIVLRVAHRSADAWQRAVRIPVSERVSSHQLLDLVCCFPLHQLGRLARFLWTFLCVPPPDSYYSYSYSSSTDDEDDDGGGGVAYPDHDYDEEDSHSD